LITIVVSTTIARTFPHSDKTVLPVCRGQTEKLLQVTHTEADSVCILYDTYYISAVVTLIASVCTLYDTYYISAVVTLITYVFCRSLTKSKLRDFVFLSVLRDFETRLDCRVALVGVVQESLSVAERSEEFCGSPCGTRVSVFMPKGDRNLKLTSI
jgi:hypothetical protein